MEKELEAVNEWIKGCEEALEYDSTLGFATEQEAQDHLQTLKNIKQALTELQAIKEAVKPSEALEKLAILASEMGTSKDTKFAETRFPKMLLAVQQALLKAQEQEKENDEYKRVLEIILEKNVDILDIRMSKTVDDYNFAISSSNLNRKDLTEEEFDVLKRYVK